MDVQGVRVIVSSLLWRRYSEILAYLGGHVVRYLRVAGYGGGSAATRVVVEML
jgi:hypothetical protein